LLLLLGAVGGFALLALVNGVLLSLLVFLLGGRSAALEARTWLVPLAFLLAIGEVVLYEWRLWRRAATVDLVGLIRPAIQEVLALLSARPAAPAPIQTRGAWKDQPPAQTDQLRAALERLQQLLESPSDRTACEELPKVLLAIRQQLDQLLGQLPKANRDELLQLQQLLERYESQQSIDRQPQMSRFTAPGSASEKEP
jgi:hypothetical protein